MDAEYEQWSDSVNEQMEYELRPFDVKCGSCGVTATDTQKALEAKGWQLDRTGEWCPVDSYVYSARRWAEKVVEFERDVQELLGDTSKETTPEMASAA